MMQPLFDNLDRNMRKKVKQLGDDQFTEVLENSIEFLRMNEELAHKINIRDLIKNKIMGH